MAFARRTAHGLLGAKTTVNKVRVRIPLAAMAVVTFFGNATALAQFGARTEVAPSIATNSEEDATASESSVAANESPRALTSTAELTLEVPGARPRETGPFGSFTTLTLRGAEANHTAVMFGDVPLGATDGGAFDLSTIPASVLSRIDVWRGGAPAWLGAGAIGGVVQLIPLEREGTHYEASLGIASFGVRTLRASASVVRRDVQEHAAVGITESNGDYPYIDDNGTAFIPTDDVERRRRNAQALEAYALLSTRIAVGPGFLQVLGSAFSRNAGIPGSASTPTELTRRMQARWFGALSYSVGDSASTPRRRRFAATLSATFERMRFTDLLGEIGLGARATDDRTLRLFARTAGEWPFASWLSGIGVLTFSHEGYAPEDALARVSNPSSARELGTGTLELRAHGHIGEVRYELRPSVRAELSHASITDDRSDFVGVVHTTDNVAPSFRVGGILAPTGWLSLSASVSSATRLPTVLEYFGDRGYLTGNPSLLPERSLGGDVGLVTRARSRGVRVQAELRAFYLHTRDQIVYTRTSLFTASPLNLASSNTRGIELAVRSTLGRHLRVVGSATFLDATNGDDRTLPLRSRFQAYGRVEGMTRRLGALSNVRVYVDLTHMGSNFADLANLLVIESRTQLGAGVGVSVLDDRLELAGSIRDIFDARGRDVLGFPLPGRSIAVTLTLRDGA